MRKIVMVIFLVLVLLLSACSKKEVEEPGVNEDSQAQEQILGEKETDRVLAPDFELKTLSGKSIRLSSLREKVVVINFYATWCPPCKAELPGFISTAEKYSDKGVEFLFIDVGEDKKTIQSFLRERNFSIDPLLDEDGIVAGRDYGVSGIPRTIIVDKEGYVAVDHQGFMQDSILTSALEEVLEEK